MDGLGLARCLAGWDDAAMTALLERRPDVLLGRPPGTLGQLAERLCDPRSLAAAVLGMRAPAVQVLEALQALGERRTRADLSAVLSGGPGSAHEAAMDAVLAELSAAALVWPDGDGRLAVSPGLGDVFPTPLGLGPTLRESWATQTADAIGRALRALGDRPSGRKAEQLAHLLVQLADPEVVRRVAARAPDRIAEGLRRMAWSGADDEDDEDDDYGYDVRMFDPESYRRQREVEGWAVEHGLMAGSTWGSVGPLPAEVALVLRGDGFRAPFTPRPPEIDTRPVTEETIGAGTAAAVTAVTSTALALLDRLARRPVPRLAGGGIGVRELSRLVKELGIGELEARLLLEVAAAGGLLHTTDDGVTITELFAGWRAAEPATQAAALIVAWWSFPGVPAEARDESEKPLPVLRRRDPCAGCQAARIVLVEAAATLPDGRAAGRGGLAATARWNRPLVHVLPQDADEPLATVLAEAELLGVLAAGTLSPLGAALLADDIGLLRERLRALLPPASESAVFGSDLTAFAAGTPSGRITQLLDGCADRESSGGAVTWRFTPVSVRRALDGGASPEALVTELAAVTERELPQPLIYLIRDVGRKHGHLRLMPAVSVIRSDDPALLAEVAADRRLGRLRLQLIAPTVLSCGVPLDHALARLREVGYFPMPDPARRPAVPEPATTDARAAPRAAPRPQAPTIEPAAVARRLLDARDTRVPVPGSETSRELAVVARHLSATEIDRLAAAMEDGGRVRIEYCAAGGTTTLRVIDGPELDGGMLHAWCELRQDERVFAVSRILSVSPAP